MLPRFTKNSLIFVLMLGIFCQYGCREPDVTFFEVKRIDETLTINDLSLVVRILETFQPDQLEALPPIFAPIPDWESNRTLSIASLMREEQDKIVKLWDLDRLARRFEKSRHLQKTLTRERIRIDQFLGLVRCLGVSIASTKVNPAYDHRLNLKRSDDRIARLEKDNRPFANLSPDQQFEVEHLAHYISRKDRCEQLIQVPDANKVLIKEYEHALKPVLPENYFNNPILEVTDWQEEIGTPFQELTDKVASDATLTWSRENNQVFNKR